MSKPESSTGRSYLLGWIVLAVVGSWAIFGMFALQPFVARVGNGMEQYGQLGDSFGVINSLFAACTVLGLVWTLRMQIEDRRIDQSERAKQSRERFLSARLEATTALLNANQARSGALQGFKPEYYKIDEETLVNDVSLVGANDALDLNHVKQPIDEHSSDETLQADDTVFLYKNLVHTIIETSLEPEVLLREARLTYLEAMDLRQKLAFLLCEAEAGFDSAAWPSGVSDKSCLQYLLKIFGEFQRNHMHATFFAACDELVYRASVLYLAQDVMILFANLWPMSKPVRSFVFEVMLELSTCVGHDKQLLDHGEILDFVQKGVRGIEMVIAKVDAGVMRVDEISFSDCLNLVREEDVKQ